MIVTAREINTIISIANLYSRKEIFLESSIYCQQCCQMSSYLVPPDFQKLYYFSMSSNYHERCHS